MHVAIVSCLEYCNKISEDVALSYALQKQNITNDVVAWDDVRVDWNKYNVAILRSAWGYHKKYKIFLQWLNLLDGYNIPLVNDTNMVRWNTDKSIQFETLKKLNIPIIPYMICSPDASLDKVYRNFGTTKLVIKPIVSASGDNTYAINVSGIESDTQQNFIRQKFKDSKFIVQPFIESISGGEYALIFIDGKFSHAVKRFPGIFTDKKQPVYVSKEQVPQKIYDIAVCAAESIKRYFGISPVYARYDIVGEEIMEIELAEPDLMTRNIPKTKKQAALTKFAQIISKRYQR